MERRRVSNRVWTLERSCVTYTVFWVVDAWDGSGSASQKYIK